MTSQTWLCINSSLSKFHQRLQSATFPKQPLQPSPSPHQVHPLPSDSIILTCFVFSIYVTPFCCRDKIADKSNLKTGGFTLSQSLKVPSAIAGEAWQEEQEVAGHMAVTVRKQGYTDAGPQVTFSFLFALGLQPWRWCHPRLGCIFPPPPNVENPLQF